MTTRVTVKLEGDWDTDNKIRASVLLHDIYSDQMAFDEESILQVAKDLSKPTGTVVTIEISELYGNYMYSKMKPFDTSKAHRASVDALNYMIMCNASMLFEGWTVDEDELVMMTGNHILGSDGWTVDSYGRRDLKLYDLIRVYGWGPGMLTDYMWERFSPEVKKELNLIRLMRFCEEVCLGFNDAPVKKYYKEMADLPMGV